MEGALQRHQNDGDGYDRRAQHLNETGGVGCPYKQRQAEPSEPGGPHAMDGHNEVQPRQNGREACNKNSQGSGDYVGIRKCCAEGRIESPAGIYASADQGP